MAHNDERSNIFIMLEQRWSHVCRSKSHIYAIGDTDDVQVELHISPKSSCYADGDKLKLALDLKTPSESHQVDIYFTILGTIYNEIYFAPAWNEIPAPFISNLVLPQDIDIKDVTLFDVELPGSFIQKKGIDATYTFAFAAVKSGIEDLVSNVALVAFEYSGKVRRLNIK